MHTHVATQLRHHALVSTAVVFAIFCSIADTQTVDPRQLTDFTPLNLTSPSYPNPYPNNVNRAFHVTAPKGFRIIAKLGFLSLERNKDFLRFGDGHGNELIRLTGRYSPPAIVSPADVLWMNFTSDGSSMDTGFQFEVSIFNKSDIRLADGTTATSGRVEVYSRYLGWGTVSSASWNLKDAAAVCKEVGLPGALQAVTGGHFGPGSGRVLMTEVDCSNDHFRLQDCPFESTCFGCPHSQDAGVECHQPNYIGCYELPNLRESYSTRETMGDCVIHCDQVGMRYAAYSGSRCFCRTSITFPEKVEDDSVCTQACAGNPNSACGSLGEDALFMVHDTEFAKCKDPGTPENATRSGNSFLIGSEVKYNCSEGFDLIGDWILTCISGHSLQESVWSSDHPYCSARVDNSTEPMEATMAPQTEPKEDNTILIIACVCAVIFGLVFLIVCIVCLCRCRRRGWCRRKPKQMEMWY